MAGNTRGKLKEQFEGIHRNFDWIQHHCEYAVKLISGRKSNLTKSIESLAKAVSALDKLARDIYDKL